MSGGGTFTNLPGGTLSGGGTLNVSGVTFTNNGAVSPGSSAGILTVAGTYNQAIGGTLDIEIGGLVVGDEYDRLVVSGTANLDGALVVTLADGFSPELGDTFDVLRYSSRSGAFRYLFGMSLPNGLFFDAVYDASGLTLVVVADPPELDCNDNGIVDDYDIASGESADCNENGVPDECDMVQGHSPDCNANRIPDDCEPGACCITPTQCAILHEDECTATGGVFRGPCSECPSQNVAVIFEAGGSVFVHVIAPPVECSTGTPRTTRACPPDAVFIDPWQSPADGNMCHFFGVEGSPAIPADFFAGGSEPFTGAVCLVGEPLGPTEFGEFGDADTLIARTEDPFDRCEFPSEVESIVALDVVALSLKSVEPITVMVNGEPEQWNASVDLSEVAAPSGTLTAVKPHCNGGTYTSVLNVQPRFTFTKVDEPKQERVLDTGLEGIDPVVLVQDTPASWVSIIDSDFGVQGDVCSAFHAGVDQTELEYDCDCNENVIHDACDADCNNNWVADDCDIVEGTSKDCNSTGVPDECEAIGGGDFDGDDSVDLGDFVELSVCMAGPDAWPQPPSPQCVSACVAAFDIDHDADVDLEDFAQFQAAVFKHP